MKKVFALAAVGLFAVSTAAWAGDGYNCGGYGKVAQTEKPTITLAPAIKQTASTETKTTKPGS